MKMASDRENQIWKLLRNATEEQIDLLYAASAKADRATITRYRSFKNYRSKPGPTKAQARARSMTFLLGAVIVVIKWLGDARGALIREDESEGSIRTSKSFDLAMRIAEAESSMRDLLEELKAAQTHFRKHAKRPIKK